MKKGKTLAVPGVLAVVAVGSGAWFLQKAPGLGANLYVQARVLEEVVARIEEHFVDEIDVEELYDAALEGVVSKLGDPNSSLLQAPDWEDMRIRTQGEYGGVGLEVSGRDSFVTVVAPIPGTPGARAGLRPGDRIVEVEGRSVVGWGTDRVAQILRGEPGTSVRMGVRRHGADRVIPFEITRAVIQLKAVPFAVLLEGGVGYVPVEIFNGTTTEEVRTRLDSLGAEGMTSLVLDLRRNRGGLLLEGVGLADLFLDAGSDIVEVRGRASARESYRAADAQARPGLPVVVLVDNGTASAAEIVAGALQDHDRALLIGAPTFGKGSVQSLFPVAGGRVLKLTTARWYTPSGRSIQKDPLEPLIDIANGVVSLRGEVVRRPDPSDRPRFTSAGGARTPWGRRHRSGPVGAAGYPDQRRGRGGAQALRRGRRLRAGAPELGGALPAAAPGHRARVRDNRRRPGRLSRLAGRARGRDRPGRPAPGPPHREVPHGKRDRAPGVGGPRPFRTQRGA